jgi:hypothetical protein
MVAARMFVLATFVPTATSSTMMIHTLGSSTTSTRLFGYFSLAYWFWYSFRWGLTTSMVARVHVALALRLKLKIWDNPFVTIFRFMVWYLSSAVSRKIEDCVMEEERI